MADVKKIPMRYFSPSPGRVCARFGTQSFIGASRTASGFVVNHNAVVAIPVLECARYVKEYRNLLRVRIPGKAPDLVEVDEAAYLAAQKSRSDKAEKLRNSRKREAEKSSAKQSKSVKTIGGNAAGDQGSNDGSESDSGSEATGA